MFTRAIPIFLLVLFTACAKPSGSPLGSPQFSAPFSSPGDDHTEVLIYGGPGSWASEVESLKVILYNHGASYQEVSPAQLNSMSLDELTQSNLIIFPGGDAPTVTLNLSAETHAKLREAVQQRGMSYLGFCAGAWLAVAPAPLPHQDVSYGLGIVDGPVLEPNYLSKEGRHFALSKASFPDGTQRDLLWYGGPITPNVAGGVIAKYPDGSPAISQIWSGKGLVMVSGLHPTATQAILEVLGLINRDAIAPDFAWKMLDGVIHRKPLAAF